MTFRELMAANGYQVQTTFWEDFSIADRFGASAIKDTYKRAFESWKDNVVYVTELSMVLNHKIWYHYHDNEALARVYDSLWKECDTWCCNNLKGDDLAYYYQTTD